MHLRRRVETDPGFPRVLFVHQSEVAGGETFFGAFWPEAAAIADPELALYGAFGVERGGLRQFVTLGYWAGILRALRHGMGRPRGDVMRNPGAFLVQAERIVARQDFAHFGEALAYDAFRAAAVA